MFTDIIFVREAMEVDTTPEIHDFVYEETTDSNEDTN